MALCSDIAAPRSIGFCSTGVAKVLSTTTGTDPDWRTTSAMSAMSSVGFAGVSTTTRPVSGRMAAATSSGWQ